MFVVLIIALAGKFCIHHYAKACHQSIERWYICREYNICVLLFTFTVYFNETGVSQFL